MILSIYVVSILIGQQGIDKSVQDRFYAEAPVGSAKLEANLSRVKGSARVFGSLGKSQSNTGSLFSFAVDGSNRKFEFSKEDRQTRISITINHVYSQENAKSFHLASVDKGPFQIKGIGSDPMDQAIFTKIFGKYIDAPWSISGYRLAEYLKSPDFLMLGAREIEVDGCQLVEIEFGAGSFKGKPNWHRVRFDPRMDWAIVDSEFRPGSSSVNPEIMKIEYPKIISDERPFPTRIMFKGLDGKQAVCEFEKIEFAPTPVNEFRMDNYGLKDVTHYVPADSSHVPLWIVVVGTTVALFAGSVCLKKMADRVR